MCEFWVAATAMAVVAMLCLAVAVGRLFRARDVMHDADQYELRLMSTPEARRNRRRTDVR